MFFTLAVLSDGSMCALAALNQGFEGPVPSWKDAGKKDVQHRIIEHTRMRGFARSGQWCERIRLHAGIGSYIYFSHAMGQARVIDELLPSVWIKSNRVGIRILANVVLPRTVDSHTGKPVSVWVHGSSYNHVGRWEQLRIQNIPHLLQQQTRVLRAQLGPHVDPREAYIESILLNVYGGQGMTDVWIDDLEVMHLLIC